ncbi:hypothetical protein JCM3770_002389 [Rhodotorula araucariae]
MGIFLHSRFVTHTHVFIGLLCAAFATFIYAWQFSRNWPNPNNFAKVVKVFAMTFHALFATQSLLTWHSLRVTSTSLSFGMWATFAIASLVFDSWWFALMTASSGAGFVAVCGADGGDCTRTGVTIASCVYFGFYGLYRLFILMVVFAFDAHFNETLLPSSASAAPALAPAPAMAMAQHPAATQQQQHPVTTVARSLAKAFQPRCEGRRPRPRARTRWAELARWAPPPPPLPQGEGEGEGDGNVPLIRAGAGAGAGAGARGPSAAAAARGKTLLFDAEEEHEGEGEDEVPAAAATRSRSPRPGAGSGFSSSSSSSSEEDEDSDDDDAEQAAYERRRAARRGRVRATVAAGAASERGQYAAV